MRILQSGKKRYVVGLTAVLAVGLGFAPCYENAGFVQTASAQSGSLQPTAAASSHSKAYTEFEALLGKGQLSQAVAYFKSHRSAVTRQEATMMTLHLENAQQNQLGAYTAKLSAPNVQSKLTLLYRQGDTFTSLAERIDNNSIRSLLKQTGASGYKLATSEGMFYPVLDYFQYLDFRPYVAPDIQAYIDIMAEESRKPPASDAALVIGYQQIVSRAVAQEHFTKTYANSNRINQIRSLYKNYVLYTYYGLNNTPLFRYEDRTIQPNASKGYKAALMYRDADGSDYLTGLAAFMKVVDQNGGKLTAEMEKYRSGQFPLTF